MHGIFSTGGHAVASGSGSVSGGASGSAGPKISKDVLRNLQDVVWSDDEEDPECPLCMEEMDPSDVNFKPCVCGYQICRFCHHQIIHDLNGLCPACRRRYDEQKIEFKPVDPEEMKKLQQHKLLKSKINKQLETLGRRNLRDVRIVIKNMVYVTGLKMPPGASVDEFLQTLRSNEWFGQYGKIAKLFLRKTPSAEDDTTDLGVYITYLRREDAARAISALDGFKAPNNPGVLLKATYGTTKYCLFFLRGMKCEDGGGLGSGSCLGLHEWAGEGDVFTRKDMTTLQHTSISTGMDLQHQFERRAAASRNPSEVTFIAKPRTSEEMADAPALPRSASWATASRSTPPPAAPQPVIGGILQPARRGKAKVLSLTNPARPTLSPHPSTSANKSRSGSAAKPAVNGDAAGEAAALSRSNSRDSTAKTGKAMSVGMSRTNSNTDSVTSAGPSAPPPPAPAPVAPPPGLESAAASRRPSAVASPVAKAQAAKQVIEDRADLNESPDAITVEAAREADATPTVANSGQQQQQQQPEVSPMPSASMSPSQSISPASVPPELQEQPYQPSIQAQALMDDIMVRRQGQATIYTIQSPYPDFEDVMECFAEGDFTYRLDDKLLVDIGDEELVLTAALQEFGRKVGISYDGAFDPFTEAEAAARDSKPEETEDAQRKQSRFGFARGPDQSDAASSLPPSNPLTALLGKAMYGDGTRHSGAEQLAQNSAYDSHARSDSRAEGTVSMTPSSKSALPYTFNGSSGSRDFNQPGQMPPPPPPGLGSANPHAFQQQSRLGILNNRQESGASPAEQQLQNALNNFQQQFQQAESRRAASPGLAGVQARNGMARFGSGFNNGQAEFSFQDPAIMAMRMGPPFSGYDGHNQLPANNPGSGLSPYPQQSFSNQDGAAIGNRLMQQFHQAQQQQRSQPGDPAAAAFGNGGQGFRQY